MGASPALQWSPAEQDALATKDCGCLDDDKQTTLSSDSDITAFLSWR